MQNEPLVTVKIGDRFSRCATCHRTDVRLRSCGRCLMRVYCGRECQRVDRPDHRERCVPVEAPNAAENVVVIDGL